MKITTKVNPSESKGPNIAAAQAIHDAQEKAIHARIMSKVATVNTAAGNAPPAPVEPPAPREDLDSIEFTLPNGMQMVFGPPKGISLTYRIISMMGGADTGIAHQRVLRLLLSVRSIDGQTITINDDIQANALANRIGDQGMELLNYYSNEYWPPIRRNELPALKKNQRI